MDLTSSLFHPVGPQCIHRRDVPAAVSLRHPDVFLATGVRHATVGCTAPMVECKHIHKVTKALAIDPSTIGFVDGQMNPELFI
jgi:hypothetical protein